MLSDVEGNFTVNRKFGISVYLTDSLIIQKIWFDMEVFIFTFLKPLGSSASTIFYFGVSTNSVIFP